MDLELVTVVIPTHKGYESILKSIDSVLKQSYSKIEIIVVDDNGLGTPAQIKTEQVLEQYIQNNKIRYITHIKNINGSAARNTGIKNANGSYIALLDDDDIFMESKITLQMQALLKNPEKYAISYTSYENIFDNGRKRTVLAEKEGILYYELLAMKMSVLSSVLLFKKEVWESIGGFDESFKRDQDQEFCVRAFFKYKVIPIKDVCMKRYVLKRNVPETVEIGINYREYYLNKMQDIIKTLPKEKQRNVYAANYAELAKRFIRRRKLWKGLKILIKGGYPLQSAKILMNDYFTYNRSKA